MFSYSAVVKSVHSNYLRSKVHDKFLRTSLRFAIAMICFACSTSPPSHLGVRNGKLAPCPDSPNCVSSQSADRRHRVEPLYYEGPAAEAMADLKAVIRSMKNAEILLETKHYLHVGCKIMGFIDDLEFYIDQREKVIHIRSASRVGYWDLGVNRRRVEKVHKRWQEKLSARSRDE